MHSETVGQPTTRRSLPTLAERVSHKINFLLTVNHQLE